MKSIRTEQFCICTDASTGSLLKFLEIFLRVRLMNLLYLSHYQFCSKEGSKSDLPDHFYEEYGVYLLIGD
jgi:hypothetical protein